MLIYIIFEIDTVDDRQISRDNECIWFQHRGLFNINLRWTLPQSVMPLIPPGFCRLIIIRFLPFNHNSLSKISNRTSENMVSLWLSCHYENSSLGFFLHFRLFICIFFICIHVIIMQIPNPVHFIAILIYII